MAIGAGSRIGPYEVTSLIGEGGMGKVWRAHHAALRRDDALKVLPDAFASDPDRLARFQREAQVLASLNHPNIAHVYGLEQANGVQALVMELVEGPTLADRIAQGPIPVDEALSIAKQIAEALEAAHEQGIVHRDLKPANVKVRPDGTVKVLDFGLAKALEPAGLRPDVSQSPTITSPAMMTGVGVLLGTAAYMSPEQARGRVVDKRSDIWAFGCVLYEMLTGRHAFDGDDVAETLAFVLTKEPDWSALPNTTPVAVRRLLRRSLMKDRNRRLPDIADARIEIDDAPSEREAVDERAAAAPRAAAGAHKRLQWQVGMLVAAAIVVAAMLMMLRSPGPPDVLEMRVDIVTPATFDPYSFALSPDGRFVAFVGQSDGNSRLWLRSLDQATARVLAGTEGAAQPFWSPDSRSIGFFAGGRLKRVEIAGGMPRTLADAAPGFGGAWGADGVILFATTSTTPLLRVSANGGEPIAQTRLDPPRQGGHGFPTFLPGGREFLFFARGTDEGQGVYLASLDVPDTTRLIVADRPPVAHVSLGQDGWLLYVQQGNLMAQRLERTKKTVSGEPVLVADSPLLTGGSSTAYGPAAFSASPSGLVAYRTGAGAQTQLTWFDRSGREVGILGARDDMGLYNPELSPDGSQVAARRTVENNTDIWVMDGARTVRRTFDAAVEQYPVWSPDGSWLAFSSLRKGVGDLYRKRTSGGGSEELLWESPRQKNVDDWSPDGRFLLFNEEDPISLRDLWVFPLNGDKKPFVFLKTNSQEHRGQFSPDGRFVAYVSSEPGPHEIFVRPFPVSDEQWQISAGGGIQPRWSHNGTELYYIAPDGTLMATTITVKDGTVEPGTPRALFQTSIIGGGTSAYTKPQYDVSSDGRFLVNATFKDSVTSPITLLLNWKPDVVR